MKAALVIMAAGMGSRYGGNKQVDGIGPNGEILMEYSIFDALRAGFTKVVFIIKPDMRDLMENMVGHHLAARKTADGDNVEVCYAYQDFRACPIFTRCRLIASSRSARCTRFYARANLCTSRSSLSTPTTITAWTRSRRSTQSSQSSPKAARARWSDTTSATP